MKREFLKYIFFILVIVLQGHGAEIYVFDIHDFVFCDYYPDSLYNLLSTEGHHIYVNADSNLDEISSYNIIYCLFPETLYHEETIRIQDFVGFGGVAILVGEHYSFFDGKLNRHINGILEDPNWIDSLGHIHINDHNDIIDTAWVYYPWDTLEFIIGEVFPNFHISTGYFSGVDTIITRWPASVSILSPDSGTAQPFIWGRYQCLTNPWGTYRHHAVLSVIADYGLGKVIVIPELFPGVIGLSDYDTSICEFDLGDNRQFMRNLFTTNDRADSVWLSGSDSTFKVFLPHCTPFVAESTSFSFNSATYGLWLRHASDCHYWNTDSSITIQYPDTCPMGETLEVCIKLVPDATGETVLPTGEVCDSFTFNYTGIEETPTPQSFAISAYPNPFNSAVTITATEGNNIDIFDITGKSVIQFSKNESI